MHPAYLAAVIDAKGSLGFDGIRIWSKSKRWLEAIKRGYPQFSGPYPVSRRSQTIWVISCTKREQLVQLLDLCLPYIIEKRREVEVLINLKVSEQWLQQKT